MVKRSAIERISPGEVITSVSQYLEYIQSVCLDFTDPLFRGHQVESWRLIPKISRLDLRDNKKLLPTEQEMLAEFKGRALPHLEFQPRTDWEWLALAQHFGMATRLLDWTTNPLAALWFAIENPSNGVSRAAVWIFHASSADYVADTVNESPFATDQTRVFRPTHLTRRIVAQDGWFTVHKFVEKPSQFVPLEDNATYKNRLSYVVVPPNAFAQLRAELNRCGMNSASLYADLPGLSKHIEWRFSPLKDEN